MFNLKNYKKADIVELITLSQKNDFKAMEELVKRVQDKIYLTFYYLCPDCDDLADLTQDALLRMCKGLSKLKNPKHYKSWLNKIISNLFYDKLRKQQKTPACISSDTKKDEHSCEILQISDPCPCPDEKTLKNEVAEIVRENISKLPQHFRIVTVLREIGGLSYNEIAKATGVEIGTVKSRINRARNKLKLCLQPYFTNN